MERSKLSVDEQVKWFKERVQQLEIELKKTNDEAELYKRLH